MSQFVSQENISLINKYTANIPRYTSYPTVPNWDQSDIDIDQWKQSVLSSYNKENQLSLYIHLPFCESLCTFCGCNKRITKNKEVQMPYIQSVLKEWSFYTALFDEKPVLRELHLGGGTPTFMSPENLKYLIEQLLAGVTIAEGHHFSFEAHPDSTTEEHLQTLHDLGFNRISIGVQDVGDHIMKAINRKQTVAQVRAVTRMARAIGYTKINYDLVYGLPFQTIDDIDSTMDLLEQERPDRIAYYSYAHVPWKSKGQRAFAEGDFKKGVDKYELFVFGRKRMLSMGYKAIGFDHFALSSDPLYKAYESGKMSRNFMGFIDNKIHCNIGLGTSAISETSDMYVQNDKVVESYYESIAKNQFSFIKGHQLSTTDSIFKKHIENLCCTEKTTWEDRSKDSICLGPFLENLIPFERDGLLAIQDKAIEILPKGKGFVRNIIAAIDPYLVNQGNTSSVFSNAI